MKLQRLHRIRTRAVALIALAAYFSCAGSFANAEELLGGHVPIDSARGAYVGADNIHWYMQDTLDFDVLVSRPRFLPVPVICNADDNSRSCEGEPLNFPFPLARSDAKAEILVHVQVDDSLDFAWRYAIKQIRDVNRLLDQSGIRGKLLIAGIESVDMNARYGDDMLVALESSFDDRLSITASSAADIVIIVMDPETADIESGFYGGPVAGLGTTTPGQGIQIAVTASANSVILAHEIGHNLGLWHEENAQDDPPPRLFPNAVAHIDTTTQCGTIMQAELFCYAPVFSSPYAVIEVEGSGEVTFGSENANAVAAANQTVWLVAIGNEVEQELSVPNIASQPLPRNLDRAGSGEKLTPTSVGSDLLLEQLRSKQRELSGPRPLIYSR